jgi:hypothetical protein
MRVRRILKAIVLAAVASAVIATGALAYFHASGSGSASGSVSVSLQPLTLTSATPTAQLYPAGTADVALTVSNVNTSPLYLASLVLDTSQGTGGFAVDASHASCAVSALQFTSQTNGGSGWTVPAKSGSTNGSLAIDLPAAISMSSGAANACQGASFTVYLKAGS